MSKKLWKFSETLVWLSAGAFFALSALVSPVAVARPSDDPAKLEDPDVVAPSDTATQPAPNKKKTKKPVITTKYGIQPPADEQPKVEPLYGVQPAPNE